MINDLMLILRDWKWIAAVAAGFVVVGLMMLAVVVSMIGFGLFVAASSATGERPPATSGQNNRRSSGPPPAAPAGRLAPELAGTWHHRAGGGETDFTGKSRYRSSRARLYRIAPDGAVEYSFERETLTIMQCEIKERRTASGRAVSDETTLTISFGETAVAESDSCEGGETASKTLPAETVALRYRLQTGPGGETELCFAEPDGEACFEKKN